LQPIPTDELLVVRKRIAEQFPERFGNAVSSPDVVLTRRPDPRTKQLAEWLADAKLAIGIRCAAAERLGGLNDPAGQGPLVTALHDPAPEIRRAAASALGSSEPRAAETIRALVQALTEEKDDGARSIAARALHGSAAKAATAELLRALKQDKAPEVREAAAFALRGAAPDPTLREALRSSFAVSQPWSLRIEAAMSAAVLFSDDTDSIGVLAAAAAVNDRWVRGRAAAYLGEFGPRAAPAAAALTKIVEKGSYRPHVIDETSHAIRALGKMGPAAKPAIPALLTKLNQDESNPHMYTPATNYVPVDDNIVAFTLARIGPDAVPALLKVLKEDKDSHRRRAAALALGYVGPPAKAVIADLEAEAKKLADLEARTDDDDWLATALEKALGRIRDAKALPLEKLE
jgi:HEAT repeat protein